MGTVTDVFAARVLGPVEIRTAGGTSIPAGRRQRALLALLLLNANRAVSTDLLIQALWGTDPPDTAVGQIQTGIWRLRRMMERDPPGEPGEPGESGPRLVTEPGGYLLRIEPDRFDLSAFQDASTRARAGLLAGRHAEAVRILQDALGLWRGQPLSNVSAPFARAEAARLEELRIAVVEDRIEAELALGRHRELVGELRDLVAAHPLRDRLRGSLMIALYRSGRQADALEAFREGRAIHVAELGLEPGPQLREIHQAILGCDDSLRLTVPEPAVTVRTEPAPPRELPPDVPDFTGRADLVTSLRDHLRPRSVEGRERTVRPLVVCGSGGSGKTALAVHTAHRTRGWYPDGQVYVSLGGLRDRPTNPADVLARLLRWLDGDDVVLPLEVEERAALFRSRIAGRRVLLVLDDAGSEGQVRPLLPGTATCGVIVTSRRRLSGLEGAVRVEVGGFSTAEGLALLEKIGGPERVAAEASAARRIVRLCGHLPLAIRIAGARLQARPHWSLDRFADLCSDAAGRLDLLVAGDRAVRSNIALGYESLDDTSRRLFRLLGSLSGAPFAGWVAGCLLDVDEVAGVELLEDLVDARLVDLARVDEHGTAWYTLHDLIWPYARERLAAEEDGPARSAALSRVLFAYLHLAERAHDRLPGGLARLAAGTAPRREVSARVLDRVTADAVTWFEAERLTLCAAVEQAAALGLDELVWDLTCCLGRFLEVRGYFTAHEEVHEVALAAVRAAGNRRGEAHLLRGLGELWTDRDRYADAMGCLRPALAIFEELGEARAQAHTIRAVGVLHRISGDMTAARALLERARTAFAGLDDPAGLADTLLALGALHKQQGRSAEALSCYQEGVALAEAVGDELNVALLLCSIGSVHLAGGRPAEADTALRESLEMCRRVGQPVGEAFALAYLGELHTATGELDRAERVLLDGLRLCEELGEEYGRGLMVRNLGELCLRRGELDRARTYLEDSAALWSRLETPFFVARSHRGLGRVAAAAGDRAGAIAHWRIAHELLVEFGSADAAEIAQLIAEAAGDPGQDRGSSPGTAESGRRANGEDAPGRPA